MRLLLDTQAFLWFIADDPRLSVTARAVIEDPTNERLFSIASVWEMAIKHSLGKLVVADPFNRFVANELAGNGVALLHISLEHATALASLPFHHRDPFDRLIIAQAQSENVSILSSDEMLDRYSVRRIW